MADPYRFDPLQFAVDKATQELPPAPTYGGFGDVVNALWRSLPPNVRNVYASVPNALAELSPGAGARDMVESSGELSRNVMAGNPLGSINAMAGIGLGAMGMIPGARAPAAVAREMTGAQRVAKALADAPTQPAGIRAYHGSPHQFDKFDISKIGTGEGAQAYGHGLYFAENEAVARGYRDALTPGNTRGHMYEVRLNADPAKMLDFNKPLREQSEAVQALARTGDISKSISQTRGMMEMFRRGAEQPHNPATGQTLYRAISDYGDNAVGATEAMTRAGIPGIQYLDAGSRAVGDGTRNFVIFDPSRIEILRRYGWIPVGVAAGGGTLMTAPDAAQAKP